MTTLPLPATIAPLDPEEFMAAYLYAGMVMENKFLEEVPALGTALIETPDGTYQFTNHPASLFGLAVMRYFRGQPDKAKAFLRRFWRLQAIFQHDEMKAYVKGAGDEIEIHYAVFEVAAQEEVSDKHEFDPEVFFQKVRAVAVRMATEEANAFKRPCDGDN
jgi:hypothetical protein